MKFHELQTSLQTKQRVMPVESRLQNPSMTPGFSKVPRKPPPAGLQLEPVSRYKTQPLLIPDNSADADLFVSKAGKAQMGPTYAVISDSAANVLHLQ